MQIPPERDIFISICMITYQHEKFISEAIDSIFMQEVNYPYELIIADDCSPDKTNVIVQNYILHHELGKTIHYIRNNKNKGVNANFRSALKSCRGKYIALCEGDDFWIDRNKLQQQVDFLEENPQYSIACSNRIVVDNNSEKLYDDFYEKQVYSLQ